jgi:hypothetical protein
MRTETTPAGTDVFDLDVEEYDAYLNAEVKRGTGLESVAAFIEAYESGRLDDSDPEVSSLISLLWIGQNGDRVQP